MNRKTIQLIAAVSLLTLVTKNVMAQDSINVVTTAVPMLRISADARTGGMGETGLAISPDVNSVFSNLSKVPFLEKKAGVAFTYTPWLKDIGVSDVYLLTFAGYYKLSENEALSTSIRYFNLGTIQFVDYSGNALGSQNPREMSFDLGYSRKLSDKIGVALALRYINSKLATGDVIGSGVNYKAASAIAADLSFYYNGVEPNVGGWSVGAAINNLGNKVAYTNDAQSKDYLPANIGVGVAYTKAFDETNKITFGLDMSKLMVPTPPADRTDESLQNYRNKSLVSSWFSSFGDASFKEEMKELQFSLGAEYWYNEQFALRAGYFYEDKTKGNRKYFTAGVGLKYESIGLNFSYLVPSGSGVTRNPLSNTLRFGILFDIDKGKK